MQFCCSSKKHERFGANALLHWCGFALIKPKDLSSLLSLSIAAREYNYARPNLTRENVLVIRGGRYEVMKHTRFHNID
jgi:hypothetical protein